MIKENDIIKAEEGKLLYCAYLNKIWGKTARLATLFEHQLIEDDFIEVDESDFELIDKDYYDFRNKSYTYIKTTIIKLHYSDDDQIALILNYQENPDKYAGAYNAMQEWRAYATQIANKYSKTLDN